MGEEAKKPEEGKKEGEVTVAAAPVKEDTAPKAEDGKKDDGAGGGEGEKKGEDGEKKDGDAPPPPPPPPEEIVIRVFMHCEGCAKKVKRSLKGFDGVEDVITDCKTHKVAVKGKKAAEDPLKVVARVQKKTGRKVELLTPLPPPKPEKKEEEKEEEKPKPEEKKPEPQVIAVILKVYMHCEACAQEIKKRILKMEGVQSVEPDLKASEVTVKGVFDAAKLVEYVYKRTGKHAAVVKQEPVEKAEDEKKADGGGEGGDAKDEKADGAAKDEKKADGAGGGDGAAKDEKGGGAEEGSEQPVVAAAKVAELMRNYYYPRYGSGYAYPPPMNAYPMTMPYAYPSHNAYPMSMPPPPPPHSYPSHNAYPPQIFSDENPNACSVM